MQQATFIDDGKSVDFVAASALENGDILQLPDGRAGIVSGLHSVSIGQTRSAMVSGRYSVPKASATVILAGESFDWNESTDLAVPAGLGTYSLGIAVEDAEDGDTKVVFDLNGQGPSDVGGELVVEEVTFAEDGAGTYTGVVNLPPGATVLDIIVHATALWAAAVSASMNVGDATDPDGFYAAINLKATDLLAGESVSFAQAGAKGGAYVVETHVLSRYSATARVISGVIVSSGAGTAGRTRMTVMFSKPRVKAAVKS